MILYWGWVSLDQFASLKAGEMLRSRLLNRRAAAWLKHENRRTVSRVVFAPGESMDLAGPIYNLWKGWGVQPVLANKLRKTLERVLILVLEGDYDVFQKHSSS